MDHDTAGSPFSGETNTRAFLSLLGSFLAFFSSVGFLNAFGVFQEYYGSHQLAHHSEFDISWIGSVAIGIMFATAPLVGVLVDCLGATIPLSLGTMGTLLSVFMTSLCTEYYQFFLSQAILLGLSMSYLFCPAVTTVSKNFQKNRGLALGITVGGSSIGGLVWPIILDRLLNHHSVGFGWTLRIVGFIMSPLLLISVATVRSSLHEEGPRTASEKYKTNLSVLRNPTFIILCAGLATCYLGLFSPFFYTTPYSKSLGMSTSMSFYMVSIVNAASLFGRVLPGLLADRYGHFNLCSVAALTSGIIAFCWAAAKSVPEVVVWSLAYGFSSGVSTPMGRSKHLLTKKAIMSLQSACAARLATHDTHGTAMGCLMGSVALTALFGTPISGEIVDTYGYLELSMYSGAILIFWAKLRLKTNVNAAV